MKTTSETQQACSNCNIELRHAYYWEDGKPYCLTCADAMPDNLRLTGDRGRLSITQPAAVNQYATSQQLIRELVEALDRIAAYPSGGIVPEGRSDIGDKQDMIHIARDVLRVNRDALSVVRKATGTETFTCIEYEQGCPYFGSDQSRWCVNCQEREALRKATGGE